MYKCIVPIKNNRTRTGAIPAFTEGLYQLADNVYSWMVPNGSWGESNHGLIAGDNQSILIDTDWDLKLTHTLLDRIEPIIQSKPITKVINTHGDGDHCWGNQLFKDQEIIASTATQQGMFHYDPKLLQKIQKLSSVATKIPIPRCKHFGHWFNHMLGPYDYSGITITPANSTFDNELGIQFDEHEVVLLEMEPAHTVGDTLVYLPNDEILFSGDILFIEGTPVLWAGNPENWINSLKKIIDLKPKTIVPGHGFFTDLSGVQRLVNYWEYVGQSMIDEFTHGNNPVQAANNIALSQEFKKLGFLEWDSPERILTSSTTLFRHWSKTAPSKASVVKTLVMFSNQAELAVKLNKLK